MFMAVRVVAMTPGAWRLGWARVAFGWGDDHLPQHAPSATHAEHHGLIQVGTLIKSIGLWEGTIILPKWQPKYI